MGLKNFLSTMVCVFLASYCLAQNTIKNTAIFTGTDYADILVQVGQVDGAVNVSTLIRRKQGVLWEKQQKLNVFQKNGQNYVRVHVKNVNPELWTPANPSLYNLFLTLKKKGKTIGHKEQRMGFRSFESKNGQLFLNNKPIFLRGIAINPPGRGIPSKIEHSRKFAYDYVRFMKSINVNIIRIPDDETWYNVCDELGMMVFGGNYSGRVNGKNPPKDYDAAVKWFETEKFSKIAQHPSLMVYAITNETPYAGSKAKPWEKFTKYAFKKLKKEWDSTRVYIGNAGYGYGKSGDICDLHRYWGWYYASPFTFLNIRNEHKLIPFDKPVQPITFTECVGNYSGPDGRYNLTPDHKNPVSQLNWTGHAPQNRQAKLASEHQVFTFKRAAELNRRLRAENSELSGVFPFTIMFHNWHTIKSFTDMEPKAVAFQAQKSYAPVLLSWEVWKPNIYAGSKTTMFYHIVNDSDDFSDLKGAKLSYALRDSSGKTYVSGDKKLPPIAYYGTYSEELQLNLPKVMPSGHYIIEGKISKNGKVVSSNQENLFVSGEVNKRYEPIERKIAVLDPSEKTQKALTVLDVNFKSISDPSNLPPQSLLIIGKNAMTAEVSAKAVQAFVQQGGRAIVLAQKAQNFGALNALLPVQLKKVDMDIDNPVYPPPERPSSNGFNINPERPAHAVFKGLTRENLKMWSDYTDWNEKKPGMPQIYPVTHGLALAKGETTKNIAVLADYSIGLEGLALAEVFQSKGSYLVSGFDLINRAGKDPFADRLLLNMIQYMGAKKQHFAHPLINSTISWGMYASEKGVLTGINSGFMLNSKPYLTGSYEGKKLVVTKEGHLFAEHRGGWNTRPGLQYVPYGRRAFGPYYHRGFGGIPEAYDYNKKGEAQFWCRVPSATHKMKTLVWNPSEENLEVSILVNGNKKKKTIPSQRQVWVENNMKPVLNNHIEYLADRRLVFLETNFE